MFYTRNVCSQLFESSTLALPMGLEDRVKKEWWPIDIKSNATLHVVPSNITSCGLIMSCMFKNN